MSIRSGLAAQIGIAPETTYGDYVAPTEFPEATSTLKDTSQWATGGGVAAGRLQRRGSRRIRTAVGAEGALTMEVANTGMGVLFQALMGGTVEPVQQEATAAYLQEHVLDDPFGKSLSVQVGVPDLTGVVRPHTYVGCKVLSADFSCAIGEQLTATFNLDSRELIEDEPLAAASYPADLGSFGWLDSTINIGATLGAATAVEGVRGVSVSFARPSRTDRNYAGNQGRKSEPIINDWQNVTGSFDVDYMDKTVFEDRFHSGEGFALEWIFEGPVIAGTHRETFAIEVPGCYLTGDTPTVGGPDIVTGSFPFEWLYDGTNKPRIRYISTDVTL